MRGHFVFSRVRSIKIELETVRKLMGVFNCLDRTLYVLVVIIAISWENPR